jgi:hypothetical protein
LGKVTQARVSLPRQEVTTVDVAVVIEVARETGWGWLIVVEPQIVSFVEAAYFC